MYGCVPPLTVDVKLTDWPVVGDAGVNEKSTDKALTETVTVTDCEVDPVLPELSVTVSITLKFVVDVGLYTWVVVAPVPVVPSPKFHA